MLQTVIIVVSIAFVLALMLVIASKVFYVPTDDTATKIREVLPGANCGACGYAGCDAYAAALAKDKSVKTNLCIPGKAKTAKKISEILNVEFADVLPTKAHVKCGGTFDSSVYIMEYQGPHSCVACNSFYTGRKSCTVGCLGFGDCVKVCKFGALSLENGVAVVDYDLCTGCGACTKICPNNLIRLSKAQNKVYVGCLSHDKGAYTRKICKAGCIGCMKCQKTCEYDAIVVVDNLASIDDDKCVSCGKCVEVCPTGAIKQY